VWVLLKTLKTFPRGGRPDWEELATKLAVGEPSFFSAAWSELYEQQLADCQDFDTAEITDEGKEALECGFVRFGLPRKRHQEKLYLRLDNGEPISWQHDFEAKDHSKLFRRPKWANDLNEELVRKALAEQRESTDERIDESDRIYDLKIHWDQSSRVKLDSSRA
jgi:hypothetical protein